jgi:DNA-binding transcriptional ArsR family regulator
MNQVAAFAETASLLADESRASILLTLLDGRAYTAKELATAANISPQTASFHLEKLVIARLLCGVRQGRHKYFRLVDDAVAQGLEAVLALQEVNRSLDMPCSCTPRLREARICFDHIAGTLGVALYYGMLRKGWVSAAADDIAMTPSARPFLNELGLSQPSYSLRPCLDWSERKFHFAGHFGRSLLSAMCEKHWVIRRPGRLLILTLEGRTRLEKWELMSGG